MKKELFGEFLGTLILVTIGCGSVAVAVLHGTLTLPQVAAIWGTGVALAIYATMSYSNAHLNPAVSFAFFLQKEISVKKLGYYTVAQVLGGFIGGLIVYFTFSNTLIDFEAKSSIIRNGENGRMTAQIFGEFFPNPGFEGKVTSSHLAAILFEMVGTFLLFVTIKIACLPFFSSKKLSPLVIGFGLALLIIWIAPFTQAGFNPARDFGPRVFAYLNGWKTTAFPQPFIGFFTVYILGPILGAGIGAIATKKMV